VFPHFKDAVPYRFYIAKIATLSFVKTAA
jgi:hypothetical protein